jgi:uncharacterized protein (TIGR02757 family)
MKDLDLKDFMDSKVVQYNQPRFLEDDPIQIPHQFGRKEDIEISAFLTATIAWGNRKSIIKNAGRMMQLMDMAPYDFVMYHQEADLTHFDAFVHRTFNSEDLLCFIRALQHLYTNHGGLEQAFARGGEAGDLQAAISGFKAVFFGVPHPLRSRKHLPDPLKGSAAKRINMFLRWMVRKDQAGVDFGIWDSISPAALSCPLDVHSGNVARKLGILKRRQNDARAVAELDLKLRQWDPADPVKYDFALFGLGVFENWS